MCNLYQKNALVKTKAFKVILLIHLMHEHKNRLDQYALDAEP